MARTARKAAPAELVTIRVVLLCKRFANVTAERTFVVIGAAVVDSLEPVALVGGEHLVPALERLGQELEVTGTHSNHPKWGAQFQVASLRLPEIRDTEGLVRWLNMQPGVGPRTAERVAETLGPDALAKIHADRALVDSVAGLQPHHRQAVVQAVRVYVEDGHKARVVTWALQHGLGPAAAHDVWKKWGPRAVDVLTADPYLLSQVDRQGFLKADALAASLGADPLAPSRMRAAAEYVMDAAVYQDGHTWLDSGDLAVRMRDMVLETGRPTREAAYLDWGPIRQAVRTLVDDGRLAREGSLVALPVMAAAEEFVAGWVRARLRPAEEENVPEKGTPIWALRLLEIEPPLTAVEVRLTYKRLLSEAHPDRQVDPEQKTAAEEHCKQLAVALDVLLQSGIHADASVGRNIQGPSLPEFGVAYAPEQMDAIRRSLVEKLLVLTGGPGTGKTTVIKGIIAAHRHRDPEVKILLAAPTGKAAKRMTEQTGLPAKTIHRLLEYSPIEGGFLRDRRNPLDGNVLIIDETSMNDQVLMRDLLDAVPEHMVVIFVGDADQLPPVGPGQPFVDMIRSGAVPVVRLQHVFRQGAESGILANAGRINNGEVPEKVPGAKDFVLRVVERGETGRTEMVGLIRQAVTELLRRGTPAEEIQVLVPMRDRGMLSADAMNRMLQEMVNPDGEAVHARPVEAKARPAFRVGDWVVCPKGGPGLDRGACGRIEAVREGAVGPAFVVRYWDGPPDPVEQGPEEIVPAKTLRIGDRVIHLVNDYKKAVFNGEVGVIVRWGDVIVSTTDENGDEHEDVRPGFFVRYDLGDTSREVGYCDRDAGALALAYALTVHKSQGSEYRAVLMAFGWDAFTLLQRNLVYTALTRAREVAAMFAEEGALERAVKTLGAARSTLLWRQIAGE